jgi:hypothetical protein
MTKRRRCVTSRRQPPHEGDEAAADGEVQGRRTRLGLTGFGGSTNLDEEPQKIGETEEEWGKKPDKEEMPLLFFFCVWVR